VSVISQIIYRYCFVMSDLYLCFLDPFSVSLKTNPSNLLIVPIKITSLTCSNLLIWRGVRDPEKPHYEEHVSDLMS
jgi:hypothetical protein